MEPVHMLLKACTGWPNNVDTEPTLLSHTKHIVDASRIQNQPALTFDKMATTPAGKSSETSILTLRVMRLAPPRLQHDIWENIDGYITTAVVPAAIRDHRAQHPSGPMPPSGQNNSLPAELLAPLTSYVPLVESWALQCPTQQGKVFAGESFRAYIDILNTSMDNIDATNVGLLVELISSNSELIVLCDTRDKSIPRLAPTEQVGLTVAHKMESPGVCGLLCHLFYVPVPASCGSTSITQADSDSKTAGASKSGPVGGGMVTQMGSGIKSVKKTFRYPCLQPFKISHRVVYVLQDEAFVEVSVENATGMQLLLLDAAILCIPQVYAKRLSHNTVEDSKEPENSANMYLANMGINDIYNFVFSVTSTVPLFPLATESDNKIGDIKRLDSLGKLRLTWRSRSGGLGMLENYVIDQHPEPPRQYEIAIKSCPSTIQVEVPFAVEVECFNRSAGTLARPAICLTRDLIVPIYFQGLSRLELQPIPPNSSRTITLQLFVIVPGLHEIRGVSLIAQEDESTRVLHEPPSLGVVLVI